MENLPMIQTTLDEWLQLTIAQPLYAAAIAISVWLLTVILYSFRISGLNKKKTASETARTNAETSLNTAQQQLQQARDDLTTANGQLAEQQRATEDEKQRALNAEQQLAQRNQQIVAIIQRLASSFDIGERPLPFTADLKAEELWQQHDKVITKLIETLRTEQQAKTELQKFYQAEKDKVAAIEPRLASLQTNLDSQTSLVLTLQTQNTTLQQQQNTAQQNLAEAMQKHQADLARLTQLEQQMLQLAGKSAPQAVVNETPTSTSIKSLFKKPEQQPQPEETVQTEDILPTPVADEPVAAEDLVIDESTEQTESSSLLKTWYHKFTSKKPETTDVEPEPVPEEPELEVTPEPEPAPPITSSEPAEEAAEKTGSVSVLKGFYQKFTSKSEVEPEPVIEPEPVVAEETPEKTSGFSVFKGFYQKATAKPAIEPEAEPVAETRLSDDEPASRIEEAADKITETVEKMKNVYGKFFSKSE